MYDTETFRQIKKIRWNYEDAVYRATAQIEGLRVSGMYSNTQRVINAMHIDVADAVDSAIARTQYA